MNDYSTTLTGPQQVVPNAGSNRRLLILFAPGAPNAGGGSGDIVYSFTVQGSALVAGAPGTLYLTGGQTVTYGGQPGGYAMPDAVYAAPVRGTSTPITALSA